MNENLTTRFEYVDRIWTLRYFWFSLVLNDLGHRYKGSFLGVGWSLIRPLAMTFLFCCVFGQLFQIEVSDFAPHLLIGMTIWQFFIEALNQGCHCFSNGSAYLRQQQVPLAIFPMRIVLGSTFHTLIALALSIIVTLFFRGILNPAALLSLVPALAYLLFLGLFLAILAGIMQTHFPDTQHILELGLQILFYLTPIVYRIESLQDRTQLSYLVKLNPLASILALFRVPIMDGTIPSMHDISVCVCLLFLVSSAAIWALRKFERNLIFWI